MRECFSLAFVAIGLIRSLAGLKRRPIDGLEMMQLNLVGFGKIHSLEATK